LRGWGSEGEDGGGEDGGDVVMEYQICGGSGV
ncbi:hypothetical protein Tco_1364036, partial [Tanacetum coccineum]